MEQAVQTVEQFLEGFKSDAWNPSEIRVNPSGDERDEIKVFMVFDGVDDATVEELRKSAEDALKAAHAELSEFTIEFRAIGE